MIRFSRLRIVLLLLLAALPCGAQVFYFNFGTNAVTDPTGRVWNGVPSAVALSATGQLTGLVDENGNSTTTGLMMISRFNGQNTNGTLLSTIFPPSVTRDSYFGNTETFGAGPDFFPSFKLTGLSAGVPHSLTFYASRAGVSDVRETAYTVKGTADQTVLLNASANVDNVVTADGVRPDANGEIIVEIGPGPENNNANHFTYLGAMKLESTPTQQPIAFVTHPAAQTVLQGRPVTFSATVNSTPPYTVQWLLNGTPIDGANAFNYTIPAVDLAMGGGRYSVRVSNLNFTGTSQQALLSVTPDTAGPTLVSSTSGGPWEIRLVFSEPLNETTALDPASYTLNAGADSVQTAVLSPDRQTLVLTPATPLPPATTLAIASLTDTVGNAYTPAGPLNFTVPQPDGLSLLVDFGDGSAQTGSGTAPDDPLHVWNNVSNTTGGNAGGSVQSLMKNDGTVTALELQMVSRFNGSNTNGTADAGPWATDATRDSLFGNTELFSNLENITPIFKITGFAPGQTCSFLFYASRMGVTDNRETTYTVTGATTGSASLNVSNNVSGTASVTGIAANEEGEITIALTPGAANNNANHFTYLGVLKVTPQPFNGQPVMLAPSLVDGVLTIRWTGEGVLESTENISGIWTPVAPTPLSPFLDSVGPVKKFYRLRYRTAP